MKPTSTVNNAEPNQITQTVPHMLRSWVPSPVGRSLPAIIWMLGIFMLSHQPKSTLEPAQPSSLFDMGNLVWGSLLDLSWDTIAGKSAHIVVFGILAYLLWWASNSTHLALWGTAGYGFLDEVHQIFIPGRTPKVTDIIFDFIGALLVVTWLWWQRRAVRANTNS